MIEHSHIVPNTRNTCHRSLTDFILWLFVNKVHKLVNSEELDLAKLSDKTRPTAKQRAAKKFQRNECTRHLQLLNRAGIILTST